MKSFLSALGLFGNTLLLSFVLFVMMAPFLGVTEAGKLTLVMLPPVIGWVRLLLAAATGQMTKRFVFLNNPGISSTLSLTNPEVMEREKDAWVFYSYLIREGLMCLVVGPMIGTTTSSLPGWPKPVAVGALNAAPYLFNRSREGGCLNIRVTESPLCRPQN